MTVEKEINQLDSKEMGRRSRKQRESLDMTREDLAGALGVSCKFLSDVEYGQKGVSIRRLYMMSQILNVTTDYILAGEMDGDDRETLRLQEDIMAPLKGCTPEQLQCMEKIARYYVEGLKSK